MAELLNAEFPQHLHDALQAPGAAPIPADARTYRPQTGANAYPQAPYSPQPWLRESGGQCSLSERGVYLVGVGASMSRGEPVNAWRAARLQNTGIWLGYLAPWHRCLHDGVASVGPAPCTILVVLRYRASAVIDGGGGTYHIHA